MKVLYIKYNKGLRTTIKADSDMQGLVLKQERISPISNAVKEPSYTEDEYNQYLTDRMLAKIHHNHMLNKTW